MADQRVQSRAWNLAAAQHGIVTRGQLLEIGFTPQAIKHRVIKGRLHPVRRGVYAVGRPELSLRGTWMAAVLSCGTGAALSHEPAGQLWGIRPLRRGRLEVSVPERRRPRIPGITVHRRARLDRTRRKGIPVTGIVLTLIDLAVGLPRNEVEAAVGEADKLDHIDPEALRTGLREFAHLPGVESLRTILDRRTFVLTDSELERHFLPLARKAGLSKPETRVYVNGYRVDFHWPALGLVVETDGLRYHRTPSQQARDARRDQEHTAAGLRTLRFTHGQIAFEPGHVEAMLQAVARLCAA